MSVIEQQTTILEVFADRLATDPDGPYLDFEGIEYSARQMNDESPSSHHRHEAR